MQGFSGWDLAIARSAVSFNYRIGAAHKQPSPSRTGTTLGSWQLCRIIAVHILLKTLWPWWNGAWEMMQEEVKVNGI